MESFLALYSLPFEEFRILLTETKSLVAGSAALALYLQQEGINPGFTPNDLDIWVEDTHDTWFSSGRINQLANDWKFSLFLVKHGYNLTTKFDSTVNEHYYNTMTNIKHIFHFINRNGKKIQVICVRDANLVLYIRHHFDLTACMSWWNASENSFHNSFPELTCKKEIEILPGFSKEERTIKRIEKYIERGFIICETPCPALKIKDPHEHIAVLKNVNAFDVFAYDDVNAAEYIRQSSYHILLHIGDQFHAYHRTQLYDYLKNHIHHNHDYGYVCELPHKQQIQYSILNILPYSDYSIISLKHIIDNLYDLEYYTTAQWFSKKSGNPNELLLYASNLRYESVIQVPEIQISHGRRILSLSDFSGLTESLLRR